AHTVDLDGPVHYVDFGGPADGPQLVLVHGLGGSCLNWCLLAPHLVTRARVVALDLAGFGLTHPRGRSTTVQANAALLDRFLRTVVGAPAILVGNSMGGMVSILESARHAGAGQGVPGRGALAGAGERAWVALPEGDGRRVRAGAAGAR